MKRIRKLFYFTSYHFENPLLSARIYNGNAWGADSPKISPFLALQNENKKAKFRFSGNFQFWFSIFPPKFRIVFASFGKLHFRKISQKFCILSLGALGLILCIYDQKTASPNPIFFPIFLKRNKRKFSKIFG